jgi:hypothetical protein
MALNGAWMKVSIGVTIDEAMLCLGTYPSLLEILPLNPDGSPGPGLLPIGRGSHFLPALPPAQASDANYVPLTVGNREVYYISENGLLANFGFDSDGNPTGAGETAFNVCALGRELKDGNLVVGADHYFTAALTGAPILDGCILQEIRIDNAGVPVAVAQIGDSMVREKCVCVSSQPAQAIGAIGLSGFLGNRVAGLGLRVSVPELTAPGGRVHAIFSIGSQMADLGVLGPGLGASVQVDLDPFLRDKTGIAYGTITLSVPGGLSAPRCCSATLLEHVGALRCWWHPSRRPSMAIRLLFCCHITGSTLRQNWRRALKVALNIICGLNPGRLKVGEAVHRCRRKP